MQGNLNHLSLATTYEVDNTFDSEKFIKLRLRVCHDGVNPNGSSFLIDDMNRAQDSLKNIPLLANVIIDEDGNPQFGAHDMHIEESKTEEGKYRIIYDEQPIGVIPETNNYFVGEYNGKNYVFTDCFVWRDYGNYAEDIINRDKDMKLSMEILVDSYKYDVKKNIFNIIDYRYKGITLLGNDRGTGMVDAMATTGTFSENGKEKLFLLMSELKNEIEKNQSSILEVDNTNLSKKEVKDLDEKLNLISKYNLKVEDLSFSIDDITLEELETKLEEFTQTKPENNQTTEIEQNQETLFSATYNQKREAVQNALPNMVKRDENGKLVEELDYWIADMNDNTVFVEVYHWIDNDYNRYYGKFEYTFDEEALTAQIVSEFVEMILVWLTKEENQKIQDDRATAESNFNQLKQDFDDYKAKYSVPNEEVETLKQYQTSKLAEEREEEEQTLFSEFDKKLVNNQEYEDLKANKSKFSITELEEKCFIILGKSAANFSLSNSRTKKKEVIKVPVTESYSNPDDAPYAGGIIEHYTKK